MSKKPDFEAFAKDVMEAWPQGDIEGFELQEKAIKHGMIVEIEGGYDPEKHDDDFGGAEPGDTWYQVNFKRP
ncbi:hypothetical protein MXMO3_01663 [Maritalea myrionectae]|uniref:Uncharacterized protein n=1 Tax=Maritalea myrionectae TaxID=454601 RepID=A0A2R4ME94_9HYPH|nr:hypothetical protein [Maritalea myrionectae]AVX04189.1 hypothetical protein MXMO3_01663 [Maritalea myrionectae]